MSTYDFLNLSPAEFEDLSRDLLQAALGLYVESFKPGKDQGIDLRAWSDKRNAIIIQCKRYSHIGDLMKELRLESEKVKKINPSRYILTTSVLLSPENKKSIAALFNGYLHEQDIYGRDALNDLLGENGAIETKHYKLWLSSVNIMLALFNNKIRVQSEQESSQFEKIKNVYVQNDSYVDAIKILKKHRFVIISGNPGVGKSTLARVLAYEHLRLGYAEFISTSASINEAFDVFKDDVSQVILFDDFLGRSFLENRYPFNEEKRLISFIEKVSASKNKILILTTREYILNQARNRYEIIKSSNINIGKCIIDVSKYTKLIKARILYNHLYFTSLPSEYIAKIIESKVYLKLVDHRNYNPRIIEAIVQRKDWEKMSSSEYVKELVKFFDRPFSVWEDAYEKDISKLSRVMLLILVSLGTPIQQKDLEVALEKFSQSFAAKYEYSLNDFNFSSSIRELHNTFISTNIDSYGTVAIDFQNPSIHDFLVSYLFNKENLQADILSEAIFFNQFFKIFTNTYKLQTKNGIIERKNKIPYKDKTFKIAKQKILSEFDSLTFSTTYRANYKDNRVQWSKESKADYSKLSMLMSELLNEDSDIHNFIVSKLQNKIYPVELGYSELTDYINLIRNLKDALIFDEVKLLEGFTNHVSFTSDLNDFYLFREIFPGSFETFSSNSSVLTNRIAQVVRNEMMNADASNYSTVIDDLLEIKEKFNYRTDSEVEELNKKQDDIEKEVDKKMEQEINQPDYDDPSILSPFEEEEIITNLFNSLKN